MTTPETTNETLVRQDYAVVDDRRAEIHRVPYDFRGTQAKILAAGLHPALAERLAKGT